MSYTRIGYILIALAVIIGVFIMPRNSVFEKGKSTTNVFKFEKADRNSVNQSVPSALRWEEPGFGK